VTQAFRRFDHACQPAIREYAFVDKMRPRGLQMHGQGGPALLQRLLRQHGQGEQADEREVRLWPSAVRRATLKKRSHAAMTGNIFRTV
jgi:hypothetical protein